MLTCQPEIGLATGGSESNSLIAQPSYLFEYLQELNSNIWIEL